MNHRLFFAETILGVIVSFLLCSSNASAQSYIGGSFRFSGSSVRNSVSTTPSTTRQTNGTSINVAPDFGWFLGDKWAVGIRPSVGFSNSTNTEGVMSRSFSLGINPYARCRLLAHHSFGLWAEADPELSFTQTRSEIREPERTSSSRSTTYGLDIVPVLTYQLNRHISLESRLNLFSFGLKGNHSVSGDSGQDSFSYGLRATTKDIVDTLGYISIGFLYAF